MGLIGRWKAGEAVVEREGALEKSDKARFKGVSGLRLPRRLEDNELLWDVFVV